MRLTTIGTGTAAPSPARVQAGHLVEAGPVRLLLDCGSGVVHRMATLGLDWSTVTHVAITHFHADHVSDLATLLVAWRWGQMPPRTEPIAIIGPPGTQGLLERHAAALWDSLLTPGFAVTVIEQPADTPLALVEGVTLTSHPVPHTAESVAYSVEHDGRRLVFTGDTGPDAALGAWAAGCDVLLAECSLPAAMAMPSHLTPEQAGELAAAARPGLLALTHFYPPVEQIDVAAIVATRWTGSMVLAHDGWSVDVSALPPVDSPSHDARPGTP
ncbi:MAG: MBL fold metallo-hydrolase [Gemmatirosa sp.]